MFVHLSIDQLNLVVTMIKVAKKAATAAMIVAATTKAKTATAAAITETIAVTTTAAKKATAAKQH